MITLEQFLKEVAIDAETVDIHSWNEKEWDYDDYFGFCGYPDNAFLLEKCKECKDYKVKWIGSEILGGLPYMRIEIQKGE